MPVFKRRFPDVQISASPFGISIGATRTAEVHSPSRVVGSIAPDLGRPLPPEVTVAVYTGLQFVRGSVVGLIAEPTPDLIASFGAIVSGCTLSNVGELIVFLRLAERLVNDGRELVRLRGPEEIEIIDYEAPAAPKGVETPAVPATAVSAPAAPAVDEDEMRRRFDAQLAEVPDAEVTKAAPINFQPVYRDKRPG